MAAARTRVRRRTRQGLLCLLPILANLAVLSLASPAGAAPAATLHVEPVPIPGFPGTGNILGAGAEVQVQVTISGTEYGGFPSPLTHMTFYAPAGVKLAPAGFTTCSGVVLEAQGPAACPRASHAGPVGEGLGVVSFGGERVNETVSLQAYFAPANQLIFFVEGLTPVSLEIVEKAYWTSAPPPYDLKAVVEVPLVETVPGADDASVLSFKVSIGAARRQGKKTISYITLPANCPPRGFPIKAELKFLSGEISTVEYNQPCPAHKR
jgi:hypothetical protein